MLVLWIAVWVAVAMALAIGPDNCWFFTTTDRELRSWIIFNIIISICRALFFLAQTHATTRCGAVENLSSVRLPFVF